MKKIIACLISAFMLFSAFAVDLELRLMPQLEVPFNSIFNLGFGGTASFDITPITIRGRDSVFFSLQGGFEMFPVKTTGVEKIDNMYFYRGGIGVGYNFRFLDRISVSPEFDFGVWSLPEVPEQVLNNIKEHDGVEVDPDKYAPSGLYIGGGVGVNYFLRPELIASLNLGYKTYFYKPENINSDFSVGVAIKYNLKKGLSPVSEIESTDVQTTPLFPVFYSRYDTNKFGTVSFISHEKNAITDIEVQLFIEQYMSNPKTVETIEYIEPEEEFSVDLTAFLNENILNSMLSRKADAQIIVNYKSLGKKMTYSETIELQSLSRNSMSWEDDRRAAAFVSGRDASALKFARQVVSIIKNDLNPNLPVNYQYAAAIFGALKAYGINYVIDPASAFTDNVGSAAVDFLQFPYQTLLYHGGDCDDLTILNCSLLEALGVPTAFITVPGHIFMAFDAGIPVDQADSMLGRNKYIVENDKVWVPVEITVSQDTFGLALSIGLREWNKYSEEHLLLPLADAWKEYKPVSVPESDITLQMPRRDVILKGYKDALK